MVSICVIILQDRKVKKFNFTISKFWAQQYEDKWPTKVGKPWIEKLKAAHMRTWCQKDSQTLFAKGDRLANSRDVNPLETIWIIVNETTYKDPLTPKTLNELRQWLLTLHLEKCFLDTLWELVHSIPHHLENVRKHNGRHFGY